MNYDTAKKPQAELQVFLCFYTNSDTKVMLALLPACPFYHGS